jgi:hypothetical protein
MRLASHCGLPDIAAQRRPDQDVPIHWRPAPPSELPGVSLLHGNVGGMGSDERPMPMRVADKRDHSIVSVKPDQTQLLAVQTALTAALASIAAAADGLAAVAKGWDDAEVTNLCRVR